MSGIKQPILDVLTKLKEINLFQFIRIWNNQIDYDKEGQLYSFPKPAAFLETVNGPMWDMLGYGITSADLVFRVHIAHEYYDAGDGTFEQDLPVFDLRDAVIKKLTLFQPTGCGPMTKILEEQDYEHDNIYHYTIDFTVNFIDSTGSDLDPNSGKYIDKQPPTELQLTINAVDSVPTMENNVMFPHPEYRINI